MFKKLIHKIHSKFYHYHKKKVDKYLYKAVGASYYARANKLKHNMKCELNSLYGLSVYADTDSVIVKKEV